jgi:hypothetical protein
MASDSLEQSNVEFVPAVGKESELTVLVGQPPVKPTEVEPEMVIEIVEPPIFPEEQDPGRKLRPWILGAITGLWSLSIFVPMGLVLWPSNGRSIMDEPAAVKVISNCQQWSSLIYMIVLLYYFPNAGLLSVIKDCFKQKK